MWGSRVPRGDPDTQPGVISRSTRGAPCGAPELQTAGGIVSALPSSPRRPASSKVCFHLCSNVDFKTGVRRYGVRGLHVRRDLRTYIAAARRSSQSPGTDFAFLAENAVLHFQCRLPISVCVTMFCSSHSFCYTPRSRQVTNCPLGRLVTWILFF